MNLFKSKTIFAEAIFKHPELILILERLNIPLGLKEKTIAEISRENNINPNLLLSFLNLHIHQLVDENMQFSKQDAEIIIHYLKSSHDYYQSEFYPEISALIKKLIQHHHSESEFKMLQQFFDEYLQEVEQHFIYEDNTVFPYITSLTKGTNKIFDYSVKEYKQHHDDIEAKLNDLKSLLVKFLPPSNDTAIRRKIITALTTLDADLEAHARIENEILIPLVEKMETENHA